jgi:AcrR family transcriptional regulator
MAQTPTSDRNKSKTPSAERRERETEMHRSQMVDAALSLFVVKGYFGTKVEDIASEAGFSRSAIYLHFPDGKEGLYASSLERAVIARHEMVASSIAKSSGEDSEHRIRRLWASFWEFRYEHPDYLKVLSLVSFDDIRALIDRERMALITGEGTETFGLIGDLMPNRRASRRDRVRRGWIVWSYFLGLSEFMDALDHVGHEQDPTEMAKQGLNVVLYGVLR